MKVVGLLVGLWFIVMGAWGATHAVRSPESPAGHWMSHPSGRRVGGALTMAVGCALALASLFWL